MVVEDSFVEADAALLAAAPLAIEQRLQERRKREIALHVGGLRGECGGVPW
jgi:hypothetical protein